MAVTHRLLLPGILLLAAAAPLQALDFKDGRWRVVIETEARGTTVKLPPKYQYEYCLTQKDLQADLAPLHPSCKSETVTEGNQVSWKFSCREQGARVHGEGRLKFSGTRFEGEISSVSEHPRNFEVIQFLRGRYLGACKPGEAQKQPGKPPVRLRDYEEIK